MSYLSLGSLHTAGTLLTVIIWLIYVSLNEIAGNESMNP